jgi:hypothetical protein
MNLFIVFFYNYRIILTPKKLKFNSLIYNLGLINKWS